MKLRRTTRRGSALMAAAALVAVLTGLSPVARGGRDRPASDGQRGGADAACLRQSPGQRARPARGPARRQPVRRRVPVRARLRLLGRSDGPDLADRDEKLAHQRRAGAAERSLLERRVLRAEAIPRRRLPERGEGVRAVAQPQRHGRDPGPALERRPLHRPGERMLIGAGDLPEADARRRPVGAVLGVGGQHLQGHTARSSSTCSTSRSRTTHPERPRPRPGIAGCTAASAPALATRSRACSNW